MTKSFNPTSTRPHQANVAPCPPISQRIPPQARRSDFNAKDACNGRDSAMGRNDPSSLFMRQATKERAQQPFPCPETVPVFPQRKQEHSQESTLNSEQGIEKALPEFVMKLICAEGNLRTAFQRVLQNGGKPGIDGITVDSFANRCDEELGIIRKELLTGTYIPSPVREVEIPKPGSKEKRKLGIPTVKDRVVQQAILQIIQPVIDPTFSEASYGSRPNRNAQQAIEKAKEFVTRGYKIAVTIDLSKFFDNVHHDTLISCFQRFTSNKYLCKLLTAILKTNKVSCNKERAKEQISPRTKGTPQGGPISPLLANLYLHKLDKELEKRNHLFVRYLDDFMILVKSLRAGQRVMESIQRFLEKKLKLTVNKEKSSVELVGNRKFLGHKILPNGVISIHPEKLENIKNKIKEITRRNGPKPLPEVICELKRRIGGIVAYFRLAGMKSHLRALDAWVRRRLRGLILHKIRTGTETPHLEEGQKSRLARTLSRSSKGVWFLSKTPQVAMILSNKWFSKIGLINLSRHHEKVKRRYRSKASLILGTALTTEGSGGLSPGTLPSAVSKIGMLIDY